MANFVLSVLFVAALGAVCTYHTVATRAAKRVMVGYGVAPMLVAFTFFGALAAGAVTGGAAWLASWSLGTSEGIKPALVAAAGGTIVVLVVFAIDRHFHGKKTAAAKK